MELCGICHGTPNYLATPKSAVCMQPVCDRPLLSGPRYPTVAIACEAVLTRSLLQLSVPSSPMTYMHSTSTSVCAEHASGWLLVSMQKIEFTLTSCYDRPPAEGKERRQAQLRLWPFALTHLMSATAHPRNIAAVRHCLSSCRTILKAPRSRILVFHRQRQPLPGRHRLNSVPTFSWRTTPLHCN